MSTPVNGDPIGNIYDFGTVINNLLRKTSKDFKALDELIDYLSQSPDITPEELTVATMKVSQLQAIGDMDRGILTTLRKIFEKAAQSLERQ